MTSLHSCFRRRAIATGRFAVRFRWVVVAGWLAATVLALPVSLLAARHQRRWSTVGCSTNIIEASWTALADAFEYSILRAQRYRDEAAG